MPTDILKHDGGGLGQESYVKFNELANRHGEVLLRLTKQIQDTRGSREQDVHKTAVSEYEEALKVAKLFAIMFFLTFSMFAITFHSFSFKQLWVINQIVAHMGYQRYIPVLMAMAKIWWDKENYIQVERVLHQAADLCSEHDIWKLNVAHNLFMHV